MTPRRHILVTGARGFVGSAVMRRAAAAGYRVTGSSRSVPSNETWIQVDQLDKRAFEAAVLSLNPDIIVDAAGVTPGPQDVDFSDNVALIENCLSAAAQLFKTRLVSVSSAALFGEGAPQDRATREEDPKRPFSAYGRSKLAAFERVKSAAKAGLDVQTGIVFNLMGPGQGAHLVPRVIIERCQNEPRPIQVGATNAVRDFLDIDDAADALLAMTEKGPPGSVANIASGQPTRIGDLFDIICAHFDTTWISTADQADSFVCYGDPTRLRDMTGWSPKYALSESIKRAIQACASETPPLQQRECTT